MLKTSKITFTPPDLLFVFSSIIPMPHRILYISTCDAFFCGFCFLFEFYYVFINQNTKWKQFNKMLKLYYTPYYTHRFLTWICFTSLFAFLVMIVYRTLNPHPTIFFFCMMITYLIQPPTIKMIVIWNSTTNIHKYTF